jgi:sec-independent protein translocase protein TatB
VFDIGWQELFVVVAIAIIVVGPRDLPRVLKTVTSYMNKMRSMVRDFQGGINEVTREIDLEDMRKEAELMADNNFGQEIKKTLEPISDLEDEFSFANKDISQESSSKSTIPKPPLPDPESTSLESDGDQGAKQLKKSSPDIVNG